MMIVFQKKSQRNNLSQLVLVFGTGLIGTAICQSILENLECTGSFFPFRWGQESLLNEDAVHLLEHLGNDQSSDQPSHTRIAVIWSAGKAGFSASKEEVEAEYISYNTILDLVDRIQCGLAPHELYFHLISSAGGFYEGRKSMCNSATSPTKRHYSRLKYKQEKSLSKLDHTIIKHIYRPTSVYGYYGMQHRKGLVTSLLLNGYRNIVTPIFGNLSTLRDYVFAGDIGDFVRRHLFVTGSEEETLHHLGSGKPCSIFEVKNLVEEALGKKIYVQFTSNWDMANNLDTVLNPVLLPDQWNPVSIDVGVKYLKSCIHSERTFNFARSEGTCTASF